VEECRETRNWREGDDRVDKMDILYIDLKVKRHAIVIFLCPGIIMFK
jgi:hypothetical protein